MKGHFTPHSEETKLKCSVAQKRRWDLGFYANRINVTPESIEKGRNTQRRGQFNHCVVCNKEFYVSPSQVKAKYCSNICKGLGKRGVNHHLWKGGKKRKFSSCWEYKNWRKVVFTRDNYTCQMCFARGGYLHAHHIKSYKAYPDLRHTPSNGITLCKECHFKLHTLLRSIKGVV